MTKYKPKVGFIYIVQDSTRHGPVKIGWSEDPMKRLKLMKWGNPNDICLIGVYLGTREEEQVVHRRLRKQRIRGEWYNLTEPEIQSLVRELRKSEQGYKHPMEVTSGS